MRQQNCVAGVIFMTIILPSAAQAQSWTVIDNAQVGKILSLEISGNSDGRQYQAINAMCAGKTLAFTFTVARPMQKPEIFINEGGFGDTRFAGEFLKTNDGGPQIISLTPAASQKLRQYIAGTEREARKAGSNMVDLVIGPGGNAGSDTVPTTGFTALANRTLTACLKTPAENMPTPVATANQPAPKEQTPVGTPETWAQVTEALDRLNQDRTCMYYNPINKGSEKRVCFSSAGLNLVGSNGISFEFNSTPGTAAARIDMQGPRKLSSIVVEIPGRVFIGRSINEVRSSIQPIFSAVGEPLGTDDLLERLAAGQDGWSRSARKTNAGFHGAFLEGGRKFHFAFIVRCGWNETRYPYCNR